MDTTTAPSTQTDAKIDAVRRLYDAYFRRDLDGAVADLADDVDWAAEAASASAPWYGSFRGKAEVPRFFVAIGSNVEIEQFDVESITSNETDVVALVRWAFTVRSTGKRAAMLMQHWFRFDGGKIVYFRGSEDSEQTAAAFS